MDGIEEEIQQNNNSGRIAELRARMESIERNGIRGFIEGMLYQSLTAELDELENRHIPKIDRYSSDLRTIAGPEGRAAAEGYYYRSCGNETLIYEGSFERLINTLYREGSATELTSAESGPAKFADLYKPRPRARMMWAIISASVQKYLGTDENKLRNGRLRRALSEHGIKILLLAAAHKGRGATDIVERYFLALKPETMSAERFRDILRELMLIDGEPQEFAVISYPEGAGHEPGEFAVRKDGTEIKIGLDAKVEDIEKIYCAGGNFRFIGVETPCGSSAARNFINAGVCYLTFGR